MKQATVDKIIAAWDAVSDDDKSTEYLISVTAANAGVEYSDVVTALRIHSERTAPKQGGK